MICIFFFFWVLSVHSKTIFILNLSLEPLGMFVNKIFFFLNILFGCFQILHEFRVLKYLEDKFHYFLNIVAQSELALCENTIVEVNW